MEPGLDTSGRQGKTTVDEAAANGEHARRRLVSLRARAAALSRHLPDRVRLGSGLEHGVLAATAGILAYLPTQAIGLREGFWAAITAIAVLQTKLDATRSTARDQFTGAALGGFIGGVLASTAGSHLWSYALAVVIAVLACWAANIASAARLSGTTATIILLVPHPGSALSMVIARVTEVGWGVSVALLVVWVADRISRLARQH